MDAQQQSDGRWAGVPESARDTDLPALLAWAAQHVPVTGAPEQVRAREWSTSARLPTVDGPAWVKAAARGFAAEPATTALLARLAPHRVLTPLATDLARGWLLLPHAGPTLAERGGADADTDADPRDADTEADLRRAHDDVARPASDAAAELLAAGVPDRRPEHLPALLEELLALLAREHPAEHRGLRADLDATRRAVARWSAELAARPGRLTVDHLDVHPGNAVGGAGRGPVRLLDWGDAVLTHPDLHHRGDPAAAGLHELVRAGTWARTTARARREHPWLGEHLRALAGRAGSARAADRP